MEDKRTNIFEFLTEHFKFKELKKTELVETPQLQFRYLILSWLFLFFVNVTALWICWNNISFIKSFHEITYSESIFLYVLVKTFFKGFFHS